MKSDININISDYNYELSDDKIAKYPLLDRSQAKLLCYSNGKISESPFTEIDKYITEDSLLIFNDTKVINARLVFQKSTGSNIEIFCLEPYAPNNYADIFKTKRTCVWKCLIGNKKKWKSGRLEKNILIGATTICLYAELVDVIDKNYIVKFEWNSDVYNFSDILQVAGSIPIPPYLNRNTQEIDYTMYQTVYANSQGSVAAPTAGLHFTKSVLDSLTQKNVILDSISLHVGAGTFVPIKTANALEHVMHTEFFSIHYNTITHILENYNKICAVGTTTVRTIESLYVVAYQAYTQSGKTDNCFIVGQWEAYDIDLKQIDMVFLIENLLSWMRINKHSTIECRTQIMIVPGFKYRFVNKLITNFHQPQSSLLLLLAAFIGSDWTKCYNYALNKNFRFLSYGDCGIYERNEN